DPQRGGRAWRERLGGLFESSSLYPKLPLGGSLRTFGGHFQRPRHVAEVGGAVGAGGEGGGRRRTPSGRPERPGRPRARTLVGDPELIFLDEPTTGFDPGARRGAWEMIRNLRSLGTTILLTTHYLDEAEQLADRVAVLRDGLIVREGKPSELTSASALTEIRFRRNGDVVVERTPEPTQRLHELIHEFGGAEIDGLEVRRPTLEDVYLELTE